VLVSLEIPYFTIMCTSVTATAPLPPPLCPPLDRGKTRRRRQTREQKNTHKTQYSQTTKVILWICHLYGGLILQLPSPHSYLRTDATTTVLFSITGCLLLNVRTWENSTKKYKRDDGSHIGTCQTAVDVTLAKLQFMDCIDGNIARDINARQRYLSQHRPL